MHVGEGCLVDNLVAGRRVAQAERQQERHGTPGAVLAAVGPTYSTVKGEARNNKGCWQASELRLAVCQAVLPVESSCYGTFDCRPFFCSLPPPLGPPTEVGMLLTLGLRASAAELAGPLPGCVGAFLQKHGVSPPAASGVGLCTALARVCRACLCKVAPVLLPFAATPSSSAATANYTGNHGAAPSAHPPAGGSRARHLGGSAGGGGAERGIPAAQAHARALQARARPATGKQPGLLHCCRRHHWRAERGHRAATSLHEAGAWRQVSALGRASRPA